MGRPHATRQIEWEMPADQAIGLMVASPDTYMTLPNSTAARMRIGGTRGAGTRRYNTTARVPREFTNLGYKGVTARSAY